MTEKSSFRKVSVENEQNHINKDGLIRSMKQKQKLLADDVLREIWDNEYDERWNDC